jgi:transposase
MEVVYTHCAGLDVHKKSVVACCVTPGAHGQPQFETRTFGTMTQDLLALSDWLSQHGVTHVALESTGEFWKPIYNILEASFVVLVANAQHIKNVPGRKTDVQDAAWIADLLRHGLLRGSFIPPLPQRDLRDLTRQRTNLVRERAEVANHLHKVLEWANLKLTSVLTDIRGVSARAMLQAIIAGEDDVTILADLAKGRMRTKRAALEQALTGRVRDHHRFLLAQHLIHLDFLDEQITAFTQQVAAALHGPEAEHDAPPEAPVDAGRPAPAPAREADPAPDRAQPARPVDWETAVELLDTIPGVGRDTAELIIAEVGTDMQRFRSAAHLASWAKVCPGNNESAGKRYSGKTGKGNGWLRSGLVQAAHAAVKVKDSYFAAVYHRLVGRRGVKKAILAIAHRILTAVYYILLHHEPYRKPGGPDVDDRRKEQLVRRMQQRIERLGFAVTVEPLMAGVG